MTLLIIGCTATCVITTAMSLWSLRELRILLDAIIKADELSAKIIENAEKKGLL